MASIKTAISIREHLFEQVEILASELNISRSRVFVLAVEEFIHRYQNRQLLERINQAYDDLPDSNERTYLSKTRQAHQNVVEGEW
jgi:metal-responsive CopG/Arc/MetJ family transcriptional regulator